MGQGVIRAVACLHGAAFALNFASMIVASIVFYKSYIRDEYEELGMIAAIVFIFCIPFYSSHLSSKIGMETSVKPSRRTVVVRMLLAAAICVLTNVYYLAAIYYGIVLPGKKIPWYLVYNLWMLLMYPMMFLMRVALRGVQYVGNERRCANSEDSTGSEVGGLTDVDVHDKKPLLSDMGEGMIWAVAGLFGAAFALNFISMIVSSVVFWPQAFARGEYEELGLLGSVIFLCCARYYSQHLAATSGIATVVKPSCRAIVVRMLLAAAVCVLTNVYCLAAVYCWIVLPGLTAPWYLIYNLWILSMFPMLFLMSVALRGVYFIGDVRRDANIEDTTGDEVASFTDSSVEVSDKKPLISEA